MKPKALDLFCGAGGASMGLHRAGFDVVGVDIKAQPRYPFEFHQADVMRVNLRAFELALPDRPEFDLVWASPPCQRFSDLAHRNKNGDDWPDLIEDVRAKLVDFGVHFVIENVERSPLRNPTMLCGTMFAGLRVLRHRLFEATFPIDVPAHGKHPLVHTFDRRKAHYGKTDDTVDFVQVTGGGNCTVNAARDAMGIEWMTKAEINEAIPPAYAEHVGRAALKNTQRTEG